MTDKPLIEKFTTVQISDYFHMKGEEFNKVVLQEWIKVSDLEKIFDEEINKKEKMRDNPAPYDEDANAMCPECGTDEVLFHQIQEDKNLRSEILGSGAEKEAIVIPSEGQREQSPDTTSSETPAKAEAGKFGETAGVSTANPEAGKIIKGIKRGCTCGFDGGRRGFGWKNCPIHSSLRTRG